MNLCWELQGSCSKGTSDYFDACVTTAHAREKLSQFPTPKSVLIRRVRQTLAIALRRINAAYILQFRRRALDSARRVGAVEGVGVPVGAAGDGI